MKSVILHTIWTFTKTIGKSAFEGAGNALKAFYEDHMEDIVALENQQDKEEE